jgi:hypothetical protein
LKKNMPSTSKAQQRASGAALAAKRGQIPASQLYGAAKQMYKGMSESDLEDFASTPTKNLPEKAKAKALDRIVKRGRPNWKGTFKRG